MHVVNPAFPSKYWSVYIPIFSHLFLNNSTTMLTKKSYQTIKIFALYERITFVSLFDVIELQHGHTHYIIMVYPLNQK